MVTRYETYLVSRVVFGLLGGDELNERRCPGRRLRQCRRMRCVERGSSLEAARRNGRGMRKAERQQRKEKDESGATHGGVVGSGRERLVLGYTNNSRELWCSWFWV